MSVSLFPSEAPIRDVILHQTSGRIHNKNVSTHLIGSIGRGEGLGAWDFWPNSCSDNFSIRQSSVKSDFLWLKNNSGRQLQEQRELGFC